MSRSIVPPMSTPAAMAPTRAIRAPTPGCHNEFAMFLLTFPCKIGPVQTEA